jgi:hypothetical protein
MNVLRHCKNLSVVQFVASSTDQFHQTGTHLVCKELSWVQLSRSVASVWPRRSTASCFARPVTSAATRSRDTSNSVEMPAAFRGGGHFCSHQVPGLAVPPSLRHSRKALLRSLGDLRPAIGCDALLRGTPKPGGRVLKCGGRGCGRSLSRVRRRRRPWWLP